MKNNKQRMEEFVLYHINGDGECNNVVLAEWSKRKKLDLQERYLLSFMFSVTYCVKSAIILFLEHNKNGALDKDSLSHLKPQILFQSDRKYMRMKDNFERCVDYFYKENLDVRKFMKNVTRGGLIDIEKAIRYVSGWVMFGRFASFLFLETFVALTEYEIRNTTIEWKKGDTATSGLLNLFGYDDMADEFDKTGRLIIPVKHMDNMLYLTMKEISAQGGDINVTNIETSLCAYRKFYKGTRYNGFYLDRMLEELWIEMPNDMLLTKELFDIRSSKFNHKYLGELGGWNGIQKDMKKAYKNTGVIT